MMAERICPMTGQVCRFGCTSDGECFLEGTGEAIAGSVLAEVDRLVSISTAQTAEGHDKADQKSLLYQVVSEKLHTQLNIRAIESSPQED